MQMLYSHRHLLQPVLIVTVLTLAALSTGVAAQSRDGSEAQKIHVSGEGRVKATPDRAMVQLGAQASEPDLAQARADVTRRSSAILQHLASLGIDERHINATHIDAQAVYRWDQKRETQILTGYRVQRSIDVNLLDLSLLPALIEGAADAGANRIAPPQLSHSRASELQRDALKAATADARANAQAIAESLDARLGPVHEINASGRPGGAPVSGDMLMRASAENTGAGADYPAGEMVFEARVSAIFTLAPASAGGDV